jgi:1,4-alpha-glucan branching enzyme
MTTEPKTEKPNVRYDFSLLTEDDLYLFNEGSHLRLYEKLGSHIVTHDGVAGTYFAVWAPNARNVSVIGDFNGWNQTSHKLQPRGSAGIWEGFVGGVGQGTKYKYWIESSAAGYKVEKADPFAIHHENPPHTASIVWPREQTWTDGEWLARRAERQSLDRPISIYEVHVGSWRRVPEDGDRWLSYRELAPQLAEYVKQMGFTHVELLPVMEHPFYGSWGYQTTGYFAPTSRYGTPQDFAYLVDYLHREGIGVILDWVPSHFPSDEHGLAYFDGTHLFEHADPRQGFHPDWKSYIFNYGRNEVRSFLLSSAMFWLDYFHADGLRVDAVASMLYLDYSRKKGEWIPNRYGGNENIEAIDFLRRLNTEVYGRVPGAQTIAEESTAWPMVSRPTYLGGLGFGLKWDMGWMHDTLDYMSKDPVYRRFHHYRLTFRMLYAFTENFVLPLSHDEVVHLKGSLISKMPGDDWQKAANLRALLANMYTQPGKKLLFMGGEFGQWREWNHESSLDWDAARHEFHASIQRLSADLNRLYASEPALHELDSDPSGFEWVDADDSDDSCITYMRKARDGTSVIVALNFTPVVRSNYRVGVPESGFWRELLNTDASEYGGSGQGNMGGVKSAPLPMHGRPHSISLTLPPLAAVILKREGGD